jgi:cellulose synthase/poly-beta-1,6-N-acetylglucosamine synthase-like glycosyltransferase
VVAQQAVSPLTITALVPAFNERDGIGDTIRSLQQQDVPFDEIIVVDDGSTDGTGDIARSYGVTVITPPTNLGSKARAQNYGLPHVTTDLVIPVDADTVFATDYVRLIKAPFADPTVAIAAGAVQTRFTKTVWERARWIEYHVGFNWFRPIQAAWNAPMVCSGCCTAFRVDMLRDFGGFPERTIVEDIDYTWSQQIMGRRAVYVGEAIAYAAEPVDARFMAKQLWRWKSGMFQNVRQHSFNLVRHKPWLALWVALSLSETLLSPVTMLLPLWWVLGLHHTVLSVAGWWAASETAVYAPPTLYAWKKRGINPLRVLANYPAFYVLKTLNFWFDWKAIVNELILVPLRLSEGLHQYEKGRADTQHVAPAPMPHHPSSPSQLATLDDLLTA